MLSWHGSDFSTISDHQSHKTAGKRTIPSIGVYQSLRNPSTSSLVSSPSNNFISICGGNSRLEGFLTRFWIPCFDGVGGTGREGVISFGDLMARCSGSNEISWHVVVDRLENGI